MNAPAPSPYSPELQALLNRLNPYQVEAVNVGEGQACLAGVPGAGKTGTIVARVARMVADGLDPEYILCMTFTRAAAQEMNERLKQLGIVGARVGTIHSVCRQIIAADTHLLEEFDLDEKNRLPMELKKTLGDLRKKKKIPNAGVDLEGVSRYVEACKAKGLCYIYSDPFGLNMRAEEFLLRQAEKWTMLAGLPRQILMDVYIELERRRGIAGLYDFNDMLLWSWMVLLTDEDARERWRGRWSVVIVDEAQDSNPVQWDIARFLVGLNSCMKEVDELPMAPRMRDCAHNLMVGGDPSQSIYAWRSAEPSLFVEFAKNKNVDELTLPINYRSNPMICAIGTGLVQGKPWHITGEIKAASEDMTTDAVAIDRYDDAASEAEGVIQQCVEIAESGEGLRSCAVLSRLRVALDLAEIACISRRIKYVKMASGSFFESREVRDILAYLRVASGYDPDGRWVAHIINRPFRYIGKGFINKCSADAMNRDISLLDAMIANEDDLSYRQRGSIEDLYKLLQRLNQIAAWAEQREAYHREKLEKAKQAGDPLEELLKLRDEVPTELLDTLADARGDIEGIGMGGMGARRRARRAREEANPEDVAEELNSAGPAEMIALVLRETDYLEELRREEGLLGMDESKAAMLAALQRMARSFKTTKEFLAYVDKLTVAVKQARKTGLKVREGSNTDALVLSTIHRAKGLEWKHVFLMDVVQGRLPNARAEDPDEELRLFYVAITRAIKTCRVSYTMPPEPEDQEEGASAPRRRTEQVGKSSYITRLEQEIDKFARGVSETR
jgi:superfamily I DNA/RNA helicase